LKLLFKKISLKKTGGIQAIKSGNLRAVANICYKILVDAAKSARNEVCFCWSKNRPNLFYIHNMLISKLIIFLYSKKAEKS